MPAHPATSADLRRFSGLCQRANTFVSQRRSYLRRAPAAEAGIPAGLRYGAMAATCYRAAAKHLVGRGEHVPAFAALPRAPVVGLAAAYDDFKAQGLVGVGMRAAGAPWSDGCRSGPPGSLPADDMAAGVRLLVLTGPEAALMMAGLGAHAAYRTVTGLGSAAWALGGAGYRLSRLLLQLPSQQDD